MPAELPPELRQALAASPDDSLELVDPTNGKAYLLLSAEAYWRVQRLPGDDLEAVGDMSRLLDDLSPEDWEDATNYDS
jgi:hypothetical protein